MELLYGTGSMRELAFHIPMQAASFAFHENFQAIIHKGTMRKEFGEKCWKERG